MSADDAEQRLTEQHLRALRRSFDEAFEKPPAQDDVQQEDLLEVRTATARYLLPVKGLFGLRQTPQVLSVPTAVPAFAGIMRERSQLLPVFDLAALLGGAPSKSARWIVLPRAAPVALAFDVFEGHRRIPATAFLSRPDGATSPLQLESGAVRVGDTTLAVLNLQAILTRIAAFRRGPAASEKP